MKLEGLKVLDIVAVFGLVEGDFSQRRGRI